MDVSDGLARSVTQMARASGLRAVLHEDLLPTTLLRRLIGARRLDPLELLLEGGEDYELLLAAPSSFEKTRPARAFTRIGELERGRGALLRRRDGSGSEISGRGFLHR